MTFQQDDTISRESHCLRSLNSYFQARRKCENDSATSSLYCMNHLIDAIRRTCTINPTSDTQRGPHGDRVPNAVGGEQRDSLSGLKIVGTYQSIAEMRGVFFDLRK